MLIYYKNGSEFLSGTTRNDWNFSGYVVSDCGGVSEFYTKHDGFHTKVDGLYATMVDHLFMHLFLHLFINLSIYSFHLFISCHNGRFCAENGVYITLRLRLTSKKLENPFFRVSSSVRKTGCEKFKYPAVLFKSSRFSSYRSQ